MAFHLLWFPFYPKDFFGSCHVRVMTHEQKCMYLELLALQWEEGSIPASKRQLAAILRVDDSKFSRVWPEIKECFVECENSQRKGRLINLRMEEERENAIAISKKNKAKALKASKVRWSK